MDEGERKATADKRYKWRDPESGILYRVHEADGWEYFKEVYERRRVPKGDPPSYASTKVPVTHRVVVPGSDEDWTTKPNAG